MSAIKYGLTIFIVFALIGCSKQPDADTAQPVNTISDVVEVSSALSGSADWILTNGKILTVDQDFSTVEAMAIEDGRIIALSLIHI